jgi:cytidylate kinase
MIIAIDGPSGSGKSTLGRMLARALKLLYIDTGSMYRAVALAVLEGNVDPTIVKRLRRWPTRSKSISKAIPIR